MKNKYFKNIDKYYFTCKYPLFKNNFVMNIEKNNHMQYINNTKSNYFKDKLYYKYNLKSFKRLNKNYIQFLDFVKPIKLFNDMKKFKGF